MHAPLVVTSAAPADARSSSRSARANLPDDFVRDIERWKTRSGVVKINLALAELPTSPPTRATSRPSTTPARSRWRPTMEYIERAFQDAREGRPAAAPFCDGVIPTDVRQDAGPRGHAHHVAVHPVGPRRTGTHEPHTDELEAYADRMIDLLRRGRARTSRTRSSHRDIVGPHEMEQEYGLIGGNIFHGELSLEQLFHMRPGARATPTTARRSPACTTPARPPTPAAASAASPAMQAARAALTDRKPPSTAPAAAGS